MRFFRKCRKAEILIKSAYRKDTHYSTKKRAKSAGRVPQSVRSEGLGRIWKCPDSTKKVSRIHENQIFSTMSKMFFFPGFSECLMRLPLYFWLIFFRACGATLSCVCHLILIFVVCHFRLTPPNFVLFCHI